MNALQPPNLWMSPYLLARTTRCTTGVARVAQVARYKDYQHSRVSSCSYKDVVATDSSGQAQQGGKQYDEGDGDSQSCVWALYKIQR